MTDPSGTALFAAPRWAQVRALAERLHELDADAATAELDRIAATDPELAHATRNLLTQTPPGAADALRDAVAHLLPVSVDTAPAQIGPFRLLRRIGAGGMGDVYLAERTGGGFVQRVALKLIDGAGHSSRLAERERRILAALTHPNITAFVDAGSADGRGWLAMEYVEGEPLLDYCGRHRLDVRARLRLVEQICAAVAYAHSQLVVHRDLKPANVLVTADGTVKLLDFGIAMMLDTSDEQAPATRVFTPEYAAPEQLRGERASTATDVYALGLVLYELVGGRRLPTLDRHGREPWTTAELARIASTAPQAERAASRIDSHAAARLLRGDLGRIIAHALVPEPAQRYTSAALLREDLRRWAAHRPLSIVRPGWRYAAMRFVRRNRAAVAVAAVAVFALVAALGIALWQAQRAQRFAANAEHGRDFVLNLFKQADPFNAHKSKTSARDLLRDAAGRIDAEFSSAPETRAQMRDAVADVLTRIGDPATARDLYASNLADLRRQFGERAPQAGAELQRLALASENAGEIDAARAQFAEAYAILHDAGDGYRAERISALTGLAKMANRAGDRAQAQHLHEAVFAERMASEGPQSADLAMDLMNLGADALYQERYADAEAYAQRAHTMLEHTLGPNHPRSIYVDNVLGQAQAHVASHVDAGVATMESAVALARAKLPPNTEMLGVVIGALGNAHFMAGNTAAAIAELREAHTILLDAHSANLDATDAGLGLAELSTRPTDALTHLRDARERQAARHAKPGDANAALTDAAYGAALAATGNAAEGERLARAARGAVLAGADSHSVRLAEIDRLLAGILARRDAVDEARELQNEALTAYRRVYRPGHPREQSLLAEMDAAK